MLPVQRGRREGAEVSPRQVADVERRRRVHAVFPEKYSAAGLHAKDTAPQSVLHADNVPKHYDTLQRFQRFGTVIPLHLRPDTAMRNPSTISAAQREPRLNPLQIPRCTNERTTSSCRPAMAALGETRLPRQPR